MPVPLDSQLRHLFGDNRAEWPLENFKKLFVTPPYYTILEQRRPSFLVGGRGTGKTTALESLKYSATYERLREQGKSFEDMTHLGVLVRINKNQVHAFQGGGVASDIWRRVFAHYLNIIVSIELVKLALWVEEHVGAPLAERQVAKVSRAYGMPRCSCMTDLADALDRSLDALQLFINNPQSIERPILSPAEGPIRALAGIIVEHSRGTNRTIFCCVDEYENLLDYQQGVCNTYIKHAHPPLSYKVGVRKNGFRNNSTIDGNDLLQTPDDFREIEVANENFGEFAVEVAERRLQRAIELGLNVSPVLSGFLKELSFEEEAVLLGAKKHADDAMRQLEATDPDLHHAFRTRSLVDWYFLAYWCAHDGGNVDMYARDWLENATSWRDRMNNYKYASLFWLAVGRKGVRIRKYYCGQRTLLALASGNIRFFLELIDAAIGYELSDKDRDISRDISLSPKSQTKAATHVGRVKLDQLEGLSSNGVELKRLVLAVGKVFYEFARTPAGRTPELTQFEVAGTDANDLDRTKKLLADGVGHLAFEVTPRTKATSKNQPKDDEYRLHPIYSGFFEMSHRKKRRVTLNASLLIEATERNPVDPISKMIGEGSQASEEDLPLQLAFFSEFYHSPSHAE